MSERHWIIAYNELPDECIFMQLEEWLPFKYSLFADCQPDWQPDWQQIGFYESRNEAYAAFLEMR